MKKLTEADVMKQVAESSAKVLKTQKIELEPEQAGRIVKAVLSTGFEAMILATKKLAAENDGEASVLFNNLFEVVISNRESEDGEKDGNQMIAILPGPQAKLLAKQDDETESEED